MQFPLLKKVGTATPVKRFLSEMRLKFMGPPPTCQQEPGKSGYATSQMWLQVFEFNEFQGPRRVVQTDARSPALSGQRLLARRMAVAALQRLPPESCNATFAKLFFAAQSRTHMLLLWLMTMFSDRLTGGTGQLRPHLGDECMPPTPRGALCRAPALGSHGGFVLCKRHCRRRPTLRFNL